MATNWALTACDLLMLLPGDPVDWIMVIKGIECVDLKLLQKYKRDIVTFSSLIYFQSQLFIPGDPVFVCFQRISERPKGISPFPYSPDPGWIKMLPHRDTINDHLVFKERKRGGCHRSLGSVEQTKRASYDTYPFQS